MIIGGGPAGAAAAIVLATAGRNVTLLERNVGPADKVCGDFLSTEAVTMVETLGVDLSAARAKRRVFCRPCVDWTERRPHIGGAVGAAMASRLFELKWIERVRDNRVVAVTMAGRRGLRESFGLAI